MKKSVWIMNHYATDSFFNKGGRHYWFAENLLKQRYQPVVFCADTRHNTDDRIDTKGSLYTKIETEGIPYVFVRTTPYQGNGISRIKNMVSFYRHLIKTAKAYAKGHGKPDVILASSVHPLTLVAGIKLAKKFGVPCICEVRDLWPESIVAYGMLKRNSLMARLLYKGEKWIYKRADALIMTWEGGKDYIADQGWDREIDLQKVHHINNGVVLETFDQNSQEYVWSDPELDDPAYRNIVYTGSIRKVNNLGLLLDAAKKIQQEPVEGRKIRFLIYGDGDELEMLQKRCEQEGIDNVLFKGRVDKKYVPGILKRAYVNVLHNSSTSLDKYGQSQNKLFEYLAAGTCIVQTYSTGYSICEKYQCGISAPVQNADEIAKAVLKACHDEDQHAIMGKNARKAAHDYDFERLTDKLIKIIEDV